MPTRACAHQPRPAHLCTQAHASATAHCAVHRMRQIKRATTYFPLLFLPTLHMVVRHAPSQVRFPAYATLMGGFSLLSAGMFMSSSIDPTEVSAAWVLLPIASLPVAHAAEKP